jgi:carbon catabolite-derepressing protein kinase
MNLQLYMVDSINYLVDFHHKKTYKASTEPGAGKFDMPPATETGPPTPHPNRPEDGDEGEEGEVVSPFVFMDVACRLILELAGGSD